MQSLSSVIALLLFLFLVYSCTGDTNSETIVIFKGDETEVPYKWSDGTITMKKRRAFSFPAFVGGVVDEKEFFAVFCDALYEVSGGASFMESATKISYADCKQWSDAEIFANMTIKKGEKTVLRSVTAVMNGNKIYALAVSGDKSLHFSPQRGSGATPLDTVIFVGTVVNSENSGGNGKTVTWEKQESLKNLFPSNIDKQSVSHFSGGLGNGVIMKNGTIVLPVMITYNRNNNNYPRTANSIIYSSDNGVTWHLGSETQFGTPKGHVVEFGEGKLILFAQSSWGSSEVFESDDMGATWKDSLIFSFVFHKRDDEMGRESYDSVVTVPVDGKDVLLFSVSLNTDMSQTINTLQLWVSDGERIVCVGTISEGEKEKFVGNSILAYVDNNLYVTYEINPPVEIPITNPNANSGEWNSVIALSPIPQLFESAKSTVREWNNLDKSFHSKGIPVNGLVGFLKNTKSDDTVWEDMYKCVHATVKGGKSVSGGFQFNGEAVSGAKWPVMSQKPNQVYTFTRYQFTLAATVKIHAKNDDEYNALLGAAKNNTGSDILIGIGFTKDKKWYTTHGKDLKNFSDFSFELEKEYHIAITLVNNEALVYVDGVKITDGTDINEHFAIIDHFYFGGLGLDPNKKTSLCTVKNVLLFTRCLEENEILQLSQVSKAVNIDDPLLNKEKSNSPNIQKTLPKTDPTSVQKMHKTVAKTGSKDPSVSGSKEFTTENKKDTNADHPLGEYRNTTFEKHMNLADSAAVVFGVVSIMCFVCSIIVLAGL